MSMGATDSNSLVSQIGPIAIVGGTLVDGNGGAPIEDAVILIDGKRIIAVGDGSTQVPPHAKKIAATGKFVIPGLMAPHTYLVDGSVLATTILYEGRYDECVIEAAQLALKGGVTTVFDAWGPRDPLIKARNAVNEGRVSAARIHLCGNWVGLGGPYSEDMRPQYKEAVGDPFAARINSLWESNVGQNLPGMSPEEVRQEVRSYVQSGVDFLSYVVNVHRRGAYQHIVFSPRLQQVIVEEAHHAGLPVQAIHITTGEGLHLALGAGADIMLLCPLGGRPLSSETVALIAQRAVPCVVLPNTASQLEWHRQHTRDPVVLGLEETKDLDARALIRAGAVLLPGLSGEVLSADTLNWWKGDSGPPDSFLQLGEGHVPSLRALQEKGMKPMDALMAATRNTARAFKLDKDLGALERGKLADLVILDRNPLQSPENYLSVWLVMKEGKVIDRDALPTQRLLTAQSLPGTRVA
jgi:imidazolonepropionase-like amidohydrolase